MHEIDAESDDKSALTHEARQKAEAEVQGDLLAVEREEARWCGRRRRRACRASFATDCSPLALLGLQAGDGTARRRIAGNVAGHSLAAAAMTARSAASACANYFGMVREDRSGSSLGRPVRTSITNRAEGQRLHDGASGRSRLLLGWLRPIQRATRPPGHDVDRRVRAGCSA